MATYYVQGDVALGSEEFTNPGFDSDTAWTKGTGWSISGGKAINDASQTGNSQIGQTISLTIGGTYRIQVDVDAYDPSAGSNKVAYFAVQNTTSSPMFNAGVGDVGTTYAMYMTAGVAFASGFRVAADVACTIDNLSCKEVLTSGSGTAADPWIGLNSVDFSGFNPGDELVISGTITTGTLVISQLNGTAAAPITIRMADDAIFDRSAGIDAYLLNSYMIYVNNCSHLLFKNLKLKGNGATWTAVHSARWLSNIYFDSSCTDIVIDGDSCTDALNRGIEIKSPTVTYPSATGNERIHIRNMTITGCRAGGISAHSLNGSVSYCTIKNNGLAWYGGDDNAITAQGLGTYIIGNYIENNGDPTVKEDHEISLDGGQDADANQGGGFFVYGNTLKNIKHSGIVVYNGGENTIIAGNVIDGFNTADLDNLETARYCAIKVGRAGTPDGVKTEKNITIANNTILNNGGSQVSGAGIAWGNNALEDYTGLRVLNNVMYGFTDGRFIYQGGLGTLTNITIDKNIYYDASTYTSRWTYGGTSYNSFSAYQSASSQEANSSAQDPKIDASYFPSRGSPANKSGTIWWSGTGVPPFSAPPEGADGNKLNLHAMVIGAIQTPRYPQDGSPSKQSKRKKRRKVFIGPNKYEYKN